MQNTQTTKPEPKTEYFENCTKCFGRGYTLTYHTKAPYIRTHVCQTCGGACGHWMASEGAK